MGVRLLWVVKESTLVVIVLVGGEESLERYFFIIFYIPSGFCFLLHSTFVSFQLSNQDNYIEMSLSSTFDKHKTMEMNVELIVEYF